MAFASLIAQDRVKRILGGICHTGNVANGYIFTGPEQCGKTTAAKEFIKLLNCTGENPPCKSCNSCHKLESNNSVDFYQLPFENSIKIEQIRELKKYVQYGAYESKYLAVIIPQAEKMTMEAANSFLKLLEEPPSGVFFIIETSLLNQLPKTILSRCQIINFSQLDTKSTAVILQHKFQLPVSEIDNIVKLSNGILPLAITYLEEKEKISKLISELDNIQQKSLNQIISLADSLTQNKENSSKEKILKYLSLLGQHFRNKLQLGQAKLVIDYLKIFQKNVNLKMALTALLLKLQEV